MKTQQLLTPMSHAEAILRNAADQVLYACEQSHDWTLEGMGVNPFTGESAYVTLTRAALFVRLQRQAVGQ